MSWLWIVVGGFTAVVILFECLSVLSLFSMRAKEFQLRIAATVTSPQRLSHQAAIESNMGRHEQALSLSDLAIRIDARCKEAWYNRGVALINLRRSAEAERAWRQAIRIDNRFWQSWQNLAALLKVLGRDQEADECLRQAVRLRTL
jgi:tetratricopeptide (TPR) repeat protein